MLSKLIKYDIRSTWRDFAGIYLSILLGVLILPQLLKYFSNNTVNVIAGFVATAIIISTIVIMIVMLFRIFNTNVFSKEGYLTMTLPVTSTQVVVSKLLVSTMWIVLTGIVAAVGVSIFVLNLNLAPLDEIAAALRKLLSMFDSRGALAAVLIIVGMITSAVKEVAKLFLACSIAHLKQLSRFRIPAGVISYFVFSWMETLIVQVFSLVASILPFGSEIARQIVIMDDFNSIQQFIGLFSGVMAAGILYSILLTVLYSIVTIVILNRKLDLD